MPHSRCLVSHPLTLHLSSAVSRLPASDQLRRREGRSGGDGRFRWINKRKEKNSSCEEKEKNSRGQCGATLPRAMVKCLIRIRTKVNVHLRMVNHCYRDVKVRVLSLGPRLLGKALGVLPLFPALPEGSSTSGSGPGSGQSSRTPSRLAVPPQQYGSSSAGNRAGKKEKMQQGFAAGE